MIEFVFVRGFGILNFEVGWSLFLFPSPFLCLVFLCCCRGVLRFCRDQLHDSTEFYALIHLTAKYDIFLIDDMLSLKALAGVALLVGMSIHLFVADTGPMALLQSAVRSNLCQLQPMYLLLYVPYFVNKFRYKATLPNKKVDWKAPPTPGVADAKRPNVILLLADDLGFNDISFYGGGFSKGLVKTPNIDSIGRNGVAFKNAYSG